MKPSAASLLLLLGLLLLLPALLLALGEAGDKPLGKVESYAVYYGGEPLEELERFDLVILSPLAPESLVRSLVGKGVVVVGYVSLTTIGGWEPWAASVSSDMVVESWGEWGEKVVDVCDPRWGEILVGEAVPLLEARGFSGVFLDNLDVVDRHPWMRECVVKLVERLRESRPDMVILVNRGFTVVDRIAPFIDGVLFECFATCYNASSGSYFAWRGEDLRWVETMAEKLRLLAENHGLVLLALGYADMDNETMVASYCSILKDLSQKYGFIPYLSDRSLQRLYTQCTPVSPLQSSLTDSLEPPPKKEGRAGKTLLILIPALLAAALLAYSYRRGQSHPP